MSAPHSELRDGAQTIYQVLFHFESLFLAIRSAAQNAHAGQASVRELEMIERLAELGANVASPHIERMSSLTDIIDELDKPAVDMSLSALQADSIKNALHALLQVIPEDQSDVVGATKVVIRLANELAMHLITGGRHKLLKESLESGGQS